jgi:ATP-binding cassette, subfamily C (CFTR/MRP), member 1
MCTVRVLSVGAVIFYVTPILVPLVIPPGVRALHFLSHVAWLQEFYRQSSRELKRIDAVSKSPIYAQFSETLNGVSTIRAFNSQLRFMGKNFQLNDAYSTAYFANNAANRWLGIRLELIGNIAVGTSALFAVLQNGNDPSTAGIVGLSVTYALDVTGTLNWAVRTFTQLESYMVSCERVREYSQMETEAPAIVESARPHASWPSEGRVKFDNVQLRYREELEPALKGVSFETKAGEKVGIVGRTGAGKSTLAVALFRITEIFRGSILVDGTDVSQIGLDDLRTKLSIIPQDPVLFAGTVRSNLDPFEDYSDAEINETLSKVHMKEWVDGTANGLLHEVQEGGSNLSVGQRQLLCMARALLRKAKVIIMDEATASVDMQTDNFIQETIREQFTGSTVRRSPPARA